MATAETVKLHVQLPKYKRTHIVSKIFFLNSILLYGKKNKIYLSQDLFSETLKLCFKHRWVTFVNTCLQLKVNNTIFTRF